MPWFLATVVTGCLTFAATNLDDILLLALFFSQTNHRFRRRHVVLGHSLGLMGIVGISLVGFWAGCWLPRPWLGLLGLLPMAIALNLLQTTSGASAPLAAQLPKPSGSAPIGILNRYTCAVAATTLANGGDNIGVYTPLFASSSLAQLGLLLASFCLLAGLWCYLGAAAARHPAIGSFLQRYGSQLVPVVLLCLGIYILFENQTLTLLNGQPQG